MEKEKHEIEGELILMKFDLMQDFDIEYSKRFLEITGIKVGDVVKAYFDTNHGTSQKSYQQVNIEDGIIRQNDKGILFICSLNPIKSSKWISDKKTGHYCYYKEHKTVSIQKISL